MSSIERYIDKLGKSTGDAAAEAIPPLTGRKAEPRRSAQQTQSEVRLDFPSMEVAGMLTPAMSEGRLVNEYRAIKRPLLRNAFGGGAAEVPNGNLIMVTSAIPGEGKSFTAINLAISMAMELDYTVLLVEADVAKPSVCRYCGIEEPRKGLVDYLADPGLELSDLLLKTNVPKLSLLPAGRVHPSSAELLGSQAMAELMHQLATRYPDRIVIFDSPPLLLSNEAVTLAGFMGQVVMVVEAARTQQTLVKQAVSLLNPEQVIGVVLNKNRTSDVAGYGGAAYGYGYEPGKQA